MCLPIPVTHTLDTRVPRLRLSAGRPFALRPGGVVAQSWAGRTRGAGDQPASSRAWRNGRRARWAAVPSGARGSRADSAWRLRRLGWAVVHERGAGPGRVVWAGWGGGVGPFGLFVGVGVGVLASSWSLCAVGSLLGVSGAVGYLGRPLGGRGWCACALRVVLAGGSAGCRSHGVGVAARGAWGR